MKTYRISALGREFGLSRTTLLYYDQIGLLRPNVRTPADYRVYNEADRARLARICSLRDAGLSLEEIGRLIDTPGQDNTILSKRLAAIGQEIAGLRTQQKLVTGMLRTLAADSPPAGLDASLWLDLQKACGLSEAALRQWHIEFEQRAASAHHAFLLSLGLSEKEALQIRMLTRNVEHNTMSMQYFFELFEPLPRQGPGCREATLRALQGSGPLPHTPAILDIGCGCGAQTLILAEALSTPILAIDNHRPVLERLAASAAAKGWPIETRELSMIDMPFPPESFDLLWAEGSIFIIGLARGLQDFRRLLKPGGTLAFSEMCWFGEERPPELQAWFDKVYPDIRSESAIRDLAVAQGYRVVDQFRLPESAWWDDYYTPMLARIPQLRELHTGAPEAEAVYGACEEEARMFQRYSRHYGYAFFVLRRA